MRFWITTHYPHLMATSPAWNIYLKGEHEAAGKAIRPGDRVLFYELQGGKRPAGAPPLPKGRGGIIAIAEVTSELHRRSAPEEYADGTRGNWQWEASCDKHDFGGFVARQDVLAVLGIKPTYKMRGFGGGTGLRELEADQYEELLRKFSSR